MASSSLVDVQSALQRARNKINDLQRRVNDKESLSESPEETSLTWTPSRELRDSLVDMYQANPRVNVELRQRLPPPSTQQLSNSTQQLSSPDRSGTSQSLDHTDLALQLLPEPPSPSYPSPLSHRRSVSPVSPPSSRSPGGAGQMEVDLSTSRGPSPRIESCGHGSDGEGASRGPGSPAFRRQLVSTEESSHQEVLFGVNTVAGRRPMLDRDKNISFLLKELDTLRNVNKKLQEELVHKEEQLMRREVEKELQEAQDWERPAAVLEEVLSAQKDRDQALMSRLLLANEERDEALLRARQLTQAAELEDIPLEDADMDVDELLRRVCNADSVQEVQQFGSALVQRLRLARQRRDDITAQEMTAVMEERDAAAAKWKRLEQEVIQERETELLKLQKERGGVIEDQQRLEVEIQVLRANHSSPHASRDLLTTSSLPKDAVSSAGLLAVAHQAPPLLAQLQQLSKAKHSVEAELQSCQEAEREASERVRRLERLVEVLRKKVDSGTLRSVM